MQAYIAPPPLPLKYRFHVIGLKSLDASDKKERLCLRLTLPTCWKLRMACPNHAPIDMARHKMVAGRLTLSRLPLASALLAAMHGESDMRGRTCTDCLK